MHHGLVLVVASLFCGWVESKKLEFFTPDNVTYKLTNIQNRFFKFNVKATNDAHVGLFTNSSDKFPWCEIVIGGWDNTQSVIRIEKLDVVILNGKTPLNKNKYAKFWLRRNKHTVLLGVHNDYEPLMVYRNKVEMPKIVNVGIHTGFGSTGKWIFDVQPDDLTQPSDCKLLDCNSYIVLDIP